MKKYFVSYAFITTEGEWGFGNCISDHNFNLSNGKGLTKWQDAMSKDLGLKIVIISFKRIWWWQ